MVNPTMPTDPAQPPYAETTSVMRLIAAELWDHLWPWSRNGFQRQRAVHAASLALALAASAVWILAAMRQMQAGALISWWFGWSAFEVIVRLGSKPYVKDGPWWGRRYRVANTMDMVCYVGFKNLLIGATLFIGLKSMGFLVVQS